MGEGDRLSPEQLAGSSPAAAGRSPRRNGAAGRKVLLIVIFAVPVLGFLLLRVVLLQSLFMPSASMSPTLPKGSLMLADRWPYLLGDPQRNDIALFHYPQSTNTEYMKRVIGLPGETIEIRDGAILINGEPMDSSFVLEEPVQDYGPIRIPDQNYFVIGDNVNHSSDSRVWGFVPRQLFISRFWFRYH